MITIIDNSYFAAPFLKAPRRCAHRGAPRAHDFMCIYIYIYVHVYTIYTYTYKYIYIYIYIYKTLTTCRDLLAPLDKALDAILLNKWPPDVAIHNNS